MEDMYDDNESIVLEEEDNGRIISKGTNNKLQHQQSLQHNKQDLDQLVELDVKPAQVNLQHLDVTINNKIDNYSGRIVGSALREDNGQLMNGVEILLYFGSGTEYPVYRTVSDENGKYFLEELPPGFYTISANQASMQCLARNIKVLPGGTSEQTLSLVRRINVNPNNWR